MSVDKILPRERQYLLFYIRSHGKLRHDCTKVDVRTGGVWGLGLPYRLWWGFTLSSVGVPLHKACTCKALTQQGRSLHRSPSLPSNSSPGLRAIKAELHTTGNKGCIPKWGTELVPVPKVVAWGTVMNSSVLWNIVNNSIPNYRKYIILQGNYFYNHYDLINLELKLVATIPCCTGVTLHISRPGKDKKGCFSEICVVK